MTATVHPKLPTPRPRGARLRRRTAASRAGETSPRHIMARHHHALLRETFLPVRKLPCLPRRGRACGATRPHERFGDPEYKTVSAERARALRLANEPNFYFFQPDLTFVSILPTLHVLSTNIIGLAIGSSLPTCRNLGGVPKERFKGSSTSSMY